MTSCRKKLMKASLLVCDAFWEVANEYDDEYSAKGERHHRGH